MPLRKNSDLPTFFVIGSAKCGTTSLHRYLDLHPEISMSAEKEPEFFAHAADPAFDAHVPDRDDYLGLFERGARERGEASTAYTYFPRIRGVPAVIAAEVPDAKLIYMVRDPVDRVGARLREAISNRHPEVRDLSLDAPAAELVGDLADPANFITCEGMYMTQIRQYLDHFPKESLLVVDSDELRSERQATMERIFGFLGVEPGFWDRRMEVELNGAGDKRVRSDLYLRLSGVDLFQKAIRRMSPRVKRDVIAAARKVLSRELVAPEIDGDLRERLRELYRPEVEEFREFTGQDFPGWSV